MRDPQPVPQLESTLKSLDTEEFVDIYFYRPIGYQWALVFNRWGVSPNSVTIASIFLGIAAGVCFSFQNVVINIVGILLLMWANMYDSADGQLARMTGQQTDWGRILDGTAGDIWFFAIYVGICVRLTPEWGIWIWLFAIMTGIFHSKQAAMADYYRNIHLFFLKGESGSELSHSSRLKGNYEKMSWKRDFVYKLFEAFYINYTVGQETLTPKFQRMMGILHEKYAGRVPEWFRVEFRQKSLPLMKYTNMLSFNTRVFVLFVSLLVNIPWFYFVFEMTVLNLMLMYMVRRHECMCESLSEKL